MRPRKISAQSADRLKDAVYRQMLRLEAGRPAAPVLLAVALLHAWMTLESQPPDGEPRRWLRRLSPVCLRMIDEACRKNCAGCRPGDATCADAPTRASGKSN